MKTSIHWSEDRSRAFQAGERSTFCDSYLGKGIFLVCALMAWPIGMVQAQERLDLGIAAVRSAYVNQLAIESRAAKAEAETWAILRGLPVRYDDGVHLFELMYLRDDRPVYYMTYNVNAAISTATDLVRDCAPYYANGDGQIIGIWDGGAVRDTHQEFVTRIRIMDGAESHWHATGVAGVIGAAGINANALGMAPKIEIHSYSSENDIPEMAEWGTPTPFEEMKTCVSNHSYGLYAGWVETQWSGNWGWHWGSPWNGANSKEDLFGQYGEGAHNVDVITYNAPYYLVFTAAGNDRSDNPMINEDVYYSPDGGANWNAISYDPLTCPAGDGEYKGGFDTISGFSVAKNVIAVGSVADAVGFFSGERDLQNATMSNFSCWGPTDDGRIKPDIVANGENLTTTHNSSDRAYNMTANGTSFSCPNASGSAILLIEYYDRLFPGRAMRSSTLKGLIIHTADDLGNPGPDYSFGWGLMNTEAAAALIKQHYDNPSASHIVEAVLDAREPTHSYTISESNVPIRVTLCWTDPPARATTGHDDTSPRLVNDLDLRIIGQSILFHGYPYVLDPNDPSAVATTGDNNLDNVEQVYMASVEGRSYIQISYKGTLWNDYQHYSLICSHPIKTEPELIGWWKLNDGFGNTVVDSSRSSAHGTIYNAVSGGLGFGGRVWVSDIGGTHLSFNGDDTNGAYVSAGRIPAMTLTNDFTWAFWAKQDVAQTKNTDVILGNRYGGNPSPLQFIKFTPTRFEFFNNDFDYLEGINYDPIPSGVWMHHALVKDGRKLTYYRDGVEAGTNTITKTIDENPFYMGGDAEGERWRGYLSDVRIYRKALTHAELQVVLQNWSNSLALIDYEGSGY